jgi:hypothetical protein
MRILELHAPYFAPRWRREHDVVTWGTRAHCDLRSREPVVRLSEILALLPAGFEPDVILLGDDSNPLFVLGLEDAPCPVAMLSVDAHHHAAWHAPLASALDAVFVAQRDYLPAFWDAGAADAQWLPLWAPDDLPPPAADQAHAVAFVGSLDVRLHPERVAFLDAVRPRLPLVTAEGPYADVFTRSRIVLNQTVRGDLNARVFEAMACGALLLTERTGNGLLDLFEDGAELVTYPRGDVDAAVAAAERYLADEAARAAIAERGRARVHAAHLESHRAAEVLARLAAPPVARQAAARHAGVARAYCVLAHFAQRVRDLLPVPALADRLRAAYLAEAAALARGRTLAEPDRSAVLGALALERGETARALGHLAFAADHGGRPEDHLARIEALVRLGDVRRARDAVAALASAHPTYDLGRQWAAILSDVSVGQEVRA